MSGEKTEAPTQKKIDDARKKGQVAVSKDAQVLFKLGLFYMFFFWVSEGYSLKFSKLMDAIVTTGFQSHHAFSKSILSLALEVFLVIAVPLIGVCAIAATLITWAQIGFLVAPESVAPSFKKFDAVGNVKNMFSKKSLVQLLISLFKVMVLGIVGYLVFKSSMGEIVYSYRVGLGSFFKILIDVLRRIIFYSLGVFLIMAVIDWSLERANLMKSLKMSKHDIKDEYKQSEGDPQMKHQRKSMHRSLLNSALNKVPSSKAVVANPTHISVATNCGVRS